MGEVIVILYNFSFEKHTSVKMEHLNLNTYAQVPTQYPMALADRTLSEPVPQTLCCQCPQAHKSVRFSEEPPLISLLRHLQYECRSALCSLLKGSPWGREEGGDDKFLKLAEDW